MKLRYGEWMKLFHHHKRINEAVNLRRMNDNIEKEDVVVSLSRLRKIRVRFHGNATQVHICDSVFESLFQLTHDEWQELYHIISEINSKVSDRWDH